VEGLAGMGGRIAFGLLGDRFGAKRVLVLGLLAQAFGALFVGLKRDNAGAIQTAIAVWWMALSLVGLIVFSTSLPAAFRGRAVAAREAASSMYAPAVAAAVGLAADAPWALLCAAAAAGIIAPLVLSPGDALAAAEEFHVRRDMMNAAGHLAATTRLSPLTSSLGAAVPSFSLLTGTLAACRARALSGAAPVAGAAPAVPGAPPAGAGDGTPALAWDGRVLRLTRRHPMGEPASVQVVAWTLRNEGSSAQWIRWQSAALSQRADWTAAWDRAQTWGQTPSAEDRLSEVRVRALSQWQIFFHRGGAWSNPLSSDGSPADTPGVPSSGTAGTATDGLAPDGIRLLLTLPDNSVLPGVITRDWVRPTLSGAKS
jgi:hypothetical protein